MPLPILTASPSTSPADLLRFYRRADLHWTRHLGEESALDAGAAFTNPELPLVPDANRLLDATLPAGLGAADAVAEVEAHYAERGVRCASWMRAASATEESFATLAAELMARSYRRASSDVMHLASPRALPADVNAAPAAGLQIIPARASFRHARALAVESAGRDHSPQAVAQRADASLLHLDDGHYDALIALHEDGTGGKVAVASVGVLAVGDIGLLREVFVSEPFRRRGIGRVMMGRALEICARSLFRHVFLAAPASSSLCANFGFRKIGEDVWYQVGE